MSSYEFCPFCQTQVCTNRASIDDHIATAHADHGVDDDRDADLVFWTEQLSLQDSLTKPSRDTQCLPYMACPNPGCTFPYGLLETSAQLQAHFDSCTSRASTSMDVPKLVVDREQLAPSRQLRPSKPQESVSEGRCETCMDLSERGTWQEIRRHRAVCGSVATARQKPHRDSVTPRAQTTGRSGRSHDTKMVAERRQERAPTQAARQSAAPNAPSDRGEPVDGNEWAYWNARPRERGDV